VDDPSCAQNIESMDVPTGVSLFSIFTVGGAGCFNCLDAVCYDLGFVTFNKITSLSPILL